MARISIVEAAKQGFKSRSQINKDVRTGKLPSFEENGRKVIDVADLVRLYGEPGSPQEIKVETAIAEQDVEKAKEEITRLETRLRETQDELKGKDSEAAKERDRLMGMVEAGDKRLADLRTDQQKVEDRQKTEHDAKVDFLLQELEDAKSNLRAERDKGIFKRLFGG